MIGQEKREREKARTIYMNIFYIFLCRIHVLGSKVRGEAHPDSRAILYESLTYKSVRERNRKDKYYLVL